MEIVVHGAVTAIWWLSSATVLLPFLLILKYNKYLRDLWFSFVFVKCLEINFAPKMAPMRKKAFELLKENLAGRNERKPLKVLEIGIGGGANFQFYPENSHLTAVDMNASFETYLAPNLKKFPQIVYERKVIAGAENMKEVEDSSMDVVVSTYVLCSVTSVKDVLKEVKRVLKPGGKFVFLEHVHHPQTDWAFTLQKFAAPLWTIYFGGCSLLRNTADEIKYARFSDVICKKLFPDWLPIYIRPQIYGIATK